MLRSCHAITSPVIYCRFSDYVCRAGKSLSVACFFLNIFIAYCMSPTNDYDYCIYLKGILKVSIINHPGINIYVYFWQNLLVNGGNATELIFLEILAMENQTGPWLGTSCSSFCNPGSHHHKGCFIVWLCIHAVNFCLIIRNITSASYRKLMFRNGRNLFSGRTSIYSDIQEEYIFYPGLR